MAKDISANSILVGNEKAVESLFDSREGSFHILLGAKGLGKMKTAEELAKSYLCIGQGEKCICDSCRKFINGFHPDYIYIAEKEDEVSIKVDDIQRLLNEINYRPSLGTYKVCIIDNANLMTQEAQNKLLKTLEELPEHMKVIFVAHAALLGTIHSRGITHTFNNLSKQTMDRYLNTLGSNVEVREVLLASAEGCPGVAKRLLENDKYLKYVEKTIKNLVEKSEPREKLNSVGLLKEKDTNSIVTVLGDDIKSFINALQSFITDIIKVNYQDNNEIIFKSYLPQIRQADISLISLSNSLAGINECLEDYQSKQLSQEKIIRILTQI